ncbi:MAG TPA: bifunctional metallophosphatase/5'-nucleotidase [Polyangia bacterium]|nr:bifunctional metallophosphatase/5'-nucleotidase [Polyangia bacterium]
MVAAAGCGGSGSTPAATPQKLTILHTNDLHSHLMGKSPEADYTPATPGDDQTTGGFARLATAIGGARAAAAAAGRQVLLLDAGDFMMGSLFEIISTRAAAELSMMNALGYDATTIGNHELDWTPAGLAGILQAATASGPTVPIVASNMNFSDSSADDDGLQALAAAGVIQTKLIKTVGTLKIGIFGLLGAEAASVTPQAAPLTFDPIATAAARMVDDLRNKDKVDVVIALSHSGIYSDGTGEDAVLAQAVPGIDVIVSGHTHDTLTQPKQIGSTWIVTAGKYGENLGQLQLSVTKGAKPGDPATVVLDGAYVLQPMDDSVPGDATTQTAVETYIGAVDTALQAASLTYRSPVAETSADLGLPAFAEAPIGNLVADAYLNVTGALQPAAPPVMGFEANGQIRSDLQKGKTGVVWFADLFRVLPDGIGPDQNPGYPLVTFYLNAADVLSGLEFDAASDVVGNDFFLQVAGLSITYDMSRPVFGRITGASVKTAAGVVPLDRTDTTTCYKVVSTNFVAGLLGVVKAQTGGVLQVVPKAADCTTVVDPTMNLVDRDPTTAPVEELKDWQALLKYVGSFPDTDGNGLPNIPAAYAMPQMRIVAK